MKKKKDKYNDGYSHEALHTTYVLMDTFESHVLQSRCCDEFKDVKKQATKAFDALYDLYQLIGGKW